MTMNYSISSTYGTSPAPPFPAALLPAPNPYQTSAHLHTVVPPPTHSTTGYLSTTFYSPHAPPPQPIPYPPSSAHRPSTLNPLARAYTSIFVPQLPVPPQPIPYPQPSAHFPSTLNPNAPEYRPRAAGLTPAKGKPCNASNAGLTPAEGSKCAAPAEGSPLAEGSSRAANVNIRRGRKRGRGRGRKLKHEGKPLQRDEENTGSNVNRPLKRDEKNTTIMIRNLPYKYRLRDLIFLVDYCCLLANLNEDPSQAAGRSVAYDFAYLPMDFRTRNSRGFAFVNFTSAEAVWKFIDAVNSRGWGWHFSRQWSKEIQIVCARIQGKEALVNHFSNSIFNCDTDEFLPVVFNAPRDGTEEPKMTFIGGRRNSSPRNHGH